MGGSAPHINQLYSVYTFSDYLTGPGKPTKDQQLTRPLRNNLNGVGGPGVPPPGNHT